MLGKTSVSMMVLLVTASLIGISSIYQYIEGQTPPPAATPRPEQLPTKFVDIKGHIQFIIMFAGGILYSSSSSFYAKKRDSSDIRSKALNTSLHQLGTK